MKKNVVFKKTAILLSLLLVMVLAFGACSSNKEQASSDADKDKAQSEESKSDSESKDNAENKDSENKEDSQNESEDSSSESAELKPIKIILDWTPNTNHTGLYCAKEMGLFEEAGFDVNIMQPPEGSTTQLIGAGGGELGISFQDTMAKNFTSNTPLPVTAVATILQHNTSGIISLKETGIDAPSKMSGKKYSTWDDPIELAMLKKMVNDDGGDFDTVELVPFGTDVISALNTDSQSAWVYYAWDGIATEVKGLGTNFIAFKDYIPETDYYTPVIIANNEWLEKNSEDAKKLVAAICEGYMYAVEHPKEAADYLLKNAPEIDKDLAYASQEWISKQYVDEGVPFGYIDPARWNAFYKWLYDEKLIETEIKVDFGFTNDYLPAN